MRSFVTVCVLAAATLCLYGLQVDTTPPSLTEDEVTIGLTAHSIATTGQDLIGRSWPLYIQVTEGSWFNPVVVYSIALVLQVLPLSEFAIRLPTVLIGVLNVVLMYFIARVLFKREGFAVLAAVLLALTPAHFLHSRFALEYLYPLPFISAWLLCLFVYLERDDWRWLFASTFMLGLGFYSYIASVIVMPMYLFLTGFTLLRRDKPVRALGIALAGFLVPLLALFVPWSIQHQSAFGHTVGHYLIYDTQRLNPLQGLRELFSHASIAARTTIYWGYFNPSFLFVDLAAPLTASTRTTGVFLFPFALLLPVGLYQAFRSGDPQRLLPVLGFVTAPVAAVIVGEQGAIGRALELLPFGVLLAVAGAMYLWSGPHLALRRVVCLAAGAIGLAIAGGYAARTLATEGRISASTPFLFIASVASAIAGILSDRLVGRMAVAASLAASALQFQYYLSDYFTDYRARASEAFLSNRRGGFEYLLERARAENIPVVYLFRIDRDVNMVEQYWRFYLAKHRREDLLSRTVTLGESQPLDIAVVPPKSAILAPVHDMTTKALAAAGELTLETLIPEPTGRPFFAVFRR